MRLNNNDSFVQGTVQGAQWYTLLGGMQVSKGLTNVPECMPWLSHVQEHHWPYPGLLPH